MLIVYSSTASQWANVPLLGLVEKGFEPHEYDVKEIDLMGAGNFDPEYLRINESGTIPALTEPSLERPLMDTRDILEYLDRARTSTASLAPKDEATKAKVHDLVELVHSMDLNTNIILLQARNMEELEEKRKVFLGFVNARQRVLEQNHARLPEHPFYAPKVEENSAIYNIYNNPVGTEHEAFFKATDQAMKGFAAGIDRLEEMLVLPYGAGSDVTYADLHIVPWLAHAMAFSGSKNFNDFGAMEALLRKSEPAFRFGSKVKTWWRAMQERESFKKVFPTLH